MWDVSSDWFMILNLALGDVVAVRSLFSWPMRRSTGFQCRCSIRSCSSCETLIRKGSLHLILSVYPTRCQLRALYWQAVLDQEMSSLAGAGETGVSEVASVGDPGASEAEIADTGNLKARPPRDASAACRGQKADTFKS